MSSFKKLRLGFILKAHSFYAVPEQGDKDHRMVILDGKRGDLCYQFFNTDHRPLSEAVIGDGSLALQALKDWLDQHRSVNIALMGHGLLQLDQGALTAIIKSSARQVTCVHKQGSPGWQALAKLALWPLERFDQALPQPFYIRAADAKIAAPLLQHV
jgi:hypothetical protein